MLRVLASCLCALLFLPGWSADPVRPALYFSGFGWMDRNTAGVSLSVSEGRASYWSGSRVYLFNPDQPLDRRLEVRDLGPKVGKEHRLAIHDGRIYVSNGRRIRTTLPGEAPQGAKPWFEREGQFHRFEVMDPSTVALLWVDPKGEHHEPLQEGHSGSEIRSRGIRLLEIWAVETNTLRHAVEVPEDMLAVMDAFQPFPFGDMRLYRSGEHLLIHVPVLGRMYAFDTARRRFTRLRTPWTEVDMGWIRPQLAGLKPGQPCVFYAPTLPMYLCASPTGDSSLLLATTVLPLTDASLVAMDRNCPFSKGAYRLLPGVPAPGIDVPYKQEWLFLEWHPGSDTLRKMEVGGPTDFRDPDQMKLQGHTGLGGGVFLDAQRDAMPMQAFLDRLEAKVAQRAAEAAEAAKAQVPAGPVTSR